MLQEFAILILIMNPTFQLGNSFYINELKEQLIEGCNEVVAFKEDSFKSLTNKALELNNKITK
jgi:hypothetical protein